VSEYIVHCISGFLMLASWSSFDFLICQRHLLDVLILVVARDRKRYKGRTYEKFFTQSSSLQKSDTLYRKLQFPDFNPKLLWNLDPKQNNIH